MTDNEIKKALDDCQCCEVCTECDSRGVCDGMSDLIILASDLINRQQEEIDGLQQLVNLSIDTQNEMNATIIEQKAEIEKLREVLDGFMDFVPACTYCDGKTADGERTEHCLYDIDYNESLIYCGKKAIELYSKLKSDLAAAKSEATKEFAGKILTEIQEAILSNDRAISERVDRHNANRYEDTFCIMCDGKIMALGGIRNFIVNLVNEMVGEDK